MKKLISALFLSFFLFQISNAQYFLKEGFLGLAKEDKKSMAITFKNLAVYPIIAGDQFLEEHRDLEKFTTLEEALEGKKIKITETVPSGEETITNNTEELSRSIDNNVNEEIQVQQRQQNIEPGRLGGSAQVNKLYLENTSTDTIFIMAGEVVKGGKQDRVLANDLVIPPNSGQIDISVFCVEKGRWSPNGSQHQFNGYFTVTSNNVRAKAAKARNQSEVWEEVAKVTQANKAGSSTGTYAALENSEAYQEETNAYRTYFNSAFGKLENCIGFVGVTGDRIIGADLFATPDLFEQQAENLINAYITDAITDGGKVKMGEKEVVDYLQTFLSENENQEQAIEEKGVQYEWRNKKIHINTY